jgi:hypothetical protein
MAPLLAEVAPRVWVNKVPRESARIVETRSIGVMIGHKAFLLSSIRKPKKRRRERKIYEIQIQGRSVGFRGEHCIIELHCRREPQQNFCSCSLPTAERAYVNNQQEKSGEFADCASSHTAIVVLSN